MRPKEFTIANINIRFEYKETLDNGDFGIFQAKRNLIQIATTHEGEPLSDEIIDNTVWHEIFHAFQYYYNNEFDEAQAQVYANFMREYETSVK